VASRVSKGLFLQELTKKEGYEREIFECIPQLGA